MYRKLGFEPSFLGGVVSVALVIGSGTASSLAATPNLVSAPATQSVSAQRPPLPTPRQQAAPFRLVTPDALLPGAGAYTTNDLPSFTINRSGEQIRLLFAGNDEVFYLTSEPASLGGRILKYDTGEIALSVAPWGGVTLYTDGAPWGIPAELQPNSVPANQVTPVAVRPALPLDVRSLAGQIAKDVAQHGPFSIGFLADWETLARQSEPTRTLAADAMRNAAYALTQMPNPRERAAAAKSLRTIRINAAAQPGVALQNGSLVISYTPDRGPSARPSSLAIGRVLAQAF